MIKYSVLFIEKADCTLGVLKNQGNLVSWFSLKGEQAGCREGNYKIYQNKVKLQITSNRFIINPIELENMIMFHILDTDAKVLLKTI